MKKVIHVYPFLIVPMILLLAISCSKDSSNSNTPPNTISFVGSYKLTGLSVTVPPFPAQSIIDSLAACQKDDIYRLNADSSFNYVDTGIVCNPPDSYNSTWSVYGTNSIRIDTVQGTIQKFDGTTLIVSSPVSYGGLSGTATETFSKQ
jgi:hypothetical protein